MGERKRKKLHGMIFDVTEMIMSQTCGDLDLLPDIEILECLSFTQKSINSIKFNSSFFQSFVVIVYPFPLNQLIIYIHTVNLEELNK